MLFPNYKEGERTGVAARHGELGRDTLDVPCAYPEAAAAPIEDPRLSVRVLIADTDKYLLESYRAHLRRDEFDVVTATGGVECVEKLREWIPDLLVLEPSIPWGGGDGVLAMMHEESDVPLVPVLVLTYGRDRGLLYRLAPFHVDDYQVKPLSAQRLAERIRAIVRPWEVATPAGREDATVRKQKMSNALLAKGSP
jgi:DNA-binding response OmpR family regulator